MNSGTYAGTMDSWTKNNTMVASASYVTGSHSIKTGINYGWGKRTRVWPTPNPANILQLRFTNNVPAQVHGAEHADRRIDRKDERRPRHLCAGCLDDRIGSR